MGALIPLSASTVELDSLAKSLDTPRSFSRRSRRYSSIMRGHRNRSPALLAVMGNLVGLDLHHNECLAPPGGEA